jgi:hypothetical protein
LPLVRRLRKITAVRDLRARLPFAAALLAANRVFEAHFDL